MCLSLIIFDILHASPFGCHAIGQTYNFNEELNQLSSDSSENSMGSCYGKINLFPCDRNTWRWLDGTYSYAAKFEHRYMHVTNYRDMCASIQLKNLQRLQYTDCLKKSCTSFLCERELDVNRKHPRKTPSVRLLNTSLDPVTYTHLHFVTCSDGHMVHDFLSCDADSYCGVARGALHCALKKRGTVVAGGAQRNVNSDGEDMIFVEMFHCQQYGGTIPFTLVCDFRQDCADRSDEEPCVYKNDSAGFK